MTAVRAVAVSAVLCIDAGVLAVPVRPGYNHVLPVLAGRGPPLLPRFDNSCIGNDWRPTQQNWNAQDSDIWPMHYWFCVNLSLPAASCTPPPPVLTPGPLPSDGVILQPPGPETPAPVLGETSSSSSPSSTSTSPTKASSTIVPTPSGTTNVSFNGNVSVPGNLTVDGNVIINGQVTAPGAIISNANGNTNASTNGSSSSSAAASSNASGMGTGEDSQGGPVLAEKFPVAPGASSGSDLASSRARASTSILRIGSSPSGTSSRKRASFGGSASTSATLSTSSRNSFSNAPSRGGAAKKRDASNNTIRVASPENGLFSALMTQYMPETDDTNCSYV